MSKAAKGMGDASIPMKQNPQAPGMPGQSRAAKGLGDASIPKNHNWEAAINQSKVGKKEAPRD